MEPRLFQGFSSSWKLAMEWMCLSHRILPSPVIISWSTLMALTRPCRAGQCHGFAKPHSSENPAVPTPLRCSRAASPR